MDDAKVELDVPLLAKELDFLRINVSAFELASLGKALRCCINWAAQTSVRVQTDAGLASQATTTTLQVSASQLGYLKSIGRPEDAARATVTTAMEADPSTVFGVVRCSTKTTADS